MGRTILARLTAGAAATAAAVPAWGYWGGHYYGPGGMYGGWGGGFFTWLIPVLVVVFVVAVLAGALRWIFGAGHRAAPPSGGGTALAILEERFARGEIDKAEFEEKRRLLSR